MKRVEMTEINEMNCADHYQYQVTWSPEDEAYIARVTEFKGLAAHSEESSEDALRELKSVVEFCIQDLKAEGEPVPEPLSSKSYSGRFNIRVPKALHRDLVATAAQQGVSLNQLILTELSRGLGHVR